MYHKIYQHTNGHIQILTGDKVLKPLEVDASGKKKSRDMSCFSNCSQLIEKREIWLNNGNGIEVAELEMSPRSHIALVG